MHVYIAGGTGVVGRRLIPLLVERGHRVTATTRDPGKAAGLQSLGAHPVVVDGLDSAAVGESVAKAEPDAVVHQMSALSGKADPKHFDRYFAMTNRLRTEGLDHLVAAAQAAGVPHIVAQSYTGWPNIRSGGWVKNEDDPLDPEPPKAQRETLDAIRYLEETVSKADGAVLRYGGFYGDASDAMIPIVRKRQFPLVGGGTGYMSWVHLDDAASATALALEQRTRGVLNIVDDEPAPASEWLPYLAECVGAKPPLRLPVWVARLVAGDVAVSMLTRTRGSSNARAKRELGWELRWPSWREGFRHGLAGES
jgi:nucleoside-diphosphate-sugar epimerase